LTWNHHLIDRVVVHSYVYDMKPEHGSNIPAGAVVCPQLHAGVQAMEMQITAGAVDKLIDMFYGADRNYTPSFSNWSTIAYKRFISLYTKPK